MWSGGRRIRGKMRNIKYLTYFLFLVMLWSCGPRVPKIIYDPIPQRKRLEIKEVMSDPCGVCKETKEADESLGLGYRICGEGDSLP